LRSDELKLLIFNSADRRCEGYTDKGGRNLKSATAMSPALEEVPPVVATLHGGAFAQLCRVDDGELWLNWTLRFQLVELLLDLLRKLVHVAPEDRQRERQAQVHPRVQLRPVVDPCHLFAIGDR
jgi:hypothetical protein